jgi:uncharacterized protein
MSHLQLKIAQGFIRRLIGLLGKSHLPVTEALQIAPCNAIHTCFMRFPIDVVFVDQYGSVCEVVTHLQPWRFAANKQAHSVIEMAAGQVSARQISTGLSISQFIAKE